MLSSEIIHRLKRWAAVLVLILPASASDLFSQAAVVKRNVILREGPATTTTRFATLQKNDGLILFELQQIDGFNDVRVAHGDVDGSFGLLQLTAMRRAALGQLTDTSGGSGW